MSKKRRAKSDNWRRRQENDVFVRQARRQGYRSRAAFKLAEMDDAEHFLRPGMAVADLGAAPGGWSQVAAERVGAGGTVAAVDKLAMAPLPGVSFMQGDFSDAAVVAAVRAVLPAAGADWVLSDMAPDLSGIAAADQAQMAVLGEAALAFALDSLRPGGGLLLKFFQGAASADFHKVLKKRFAAVKIVHPRATRRASKEIYFLAREPNLG